MTAIRRRVSKTRANVGVCLKETRLILGPRYRYKNTYTPEYASDFVKQLDGHHFGNFNPRPSVENQWNILFRGRSMCHVVFLSLFLGLVHM